MASLTDEQRKKIEENKRRALQVRLEKQQFSSAVSNHKLNQTKTISASNQTVKDTNSGYQRSSDPNFKSVVPQVANQFTSRRQNLLTVKKPSASLPAQYAADQSKPSQTSIDLQAFYSSSTHNATHTTTTIKGKCVLISKDKFKVDVAYHAGFVEYCKTMKSKTYDAIAKNWSFGIEEYETFMQGARNFQPDVIIESLPANVLKVLRSVKKVDCQKLEPDLSKVDDILVNTLLPFQREGVRIAISRNGRLLIADDMGLGKTLQAICIAYYYRNEWPLLVVAPSSVRFAWAQQICKWLPSVPESEVNVVESSKNSATKGLVNILSYDLLAKKADQLRKQKFQVVIMDESHFLKNFKAVRTRAAMPLLKGAKRVILLSGTPALSRPNELFVQIIAVCPDLFNFHDFGLRYCDAKQKQWGWDYSGSSNMQELQILLEAKVMIRRQKKDVLSQLPEKTRQMMLLDPAGLKCGKELKLLSGAMGKGRLKGMERQGLLLQYFHETCKAKLSVVRDYVADMIESEKKFLVFAHHREMLDAIEDCVIGKGGGKKYIRIDGNTNSEQRNYFCHKFQTSEDYQVAILSITAANAGLNLSAASIVIFAELFWNPGILVQAEDRVHRIGQKDSVSIQYLVAQGTADDYVWPLIQDKLNVLSKAGLTKDNFSEADTKRLKDNKQQTILEMFQSDFLEESQPILMEETTSQMDAESSAIVRKLEGETTSPVKASPSKRQASITNFFPKSPPKKQVKLDLTIDVASKSCDDKADTSLLEDLEAIDWDDDIDIQ